MSDLDLKIEDAAYHVGEVVKVLGDEKWRLIERVFISSPHGYESFCYELRGGTTVTQQQIYDSIGNLPD